MRSDWPYVNGELVKGVLCILWGQLGKFEYTQIWLLNNIKDFINLAACD